MAKNKDITPVAEPVSRKTNEEIDANDDGELILHGKTFSETRRRQADPEANHIDDDDALHIED